MTISYVGRASTGGYSEPFAVNFPSGVQDGDFLIAMASGGSSGVSPGSGSDWEALPLDDNMLNRSLFDRASLFTSLRSAIFIREYKVGSVNDPWYPGFEENATVSIYAFRSSSGKLFLDDFSARGYGNGSTVKSWETGAAVLIGFRPGGGSFTFSSNISSPVNLTVQGGENIYFKDGVVGDVTYTVTSGSIHLGCAIKLIEAQKLIKHVDTYSVSTQQGVNTFLPPERSKAGDLLFAVIASTSYDGYAYAMTPFAGQGWTLIDSATGDDLYNPDTKFRIDFYVRVADGASTQWNNAAGVSRVTLSCFRGLYGNISYGYSGQKNSSTTGQVSINLSLTSPGNLALIALVSSTASVYRVQTKGGAVPFILDFSSGVKSLTGLNIPNSGDCSLQNALAISLTSIPVASTNQFFKHNF